MNSRFAVVILALLGLILSLLLASCGKPPTNCRAIADSAEVECEQRPASLGMDASSCRIYRDALYMQCVGARVTSNR